MKTKTILKILLVLLFITATMQAKTQIVYSDLEPDAILEDTIITPTEPECYMLDLNNDGTSDFQICIIYFVQLPDPPARTVRITVVENTQNKIAVNENDELKALFLNSNDSINEQLTWTIHSAIICTNSTIGNYLCPSDEKYYALAIKINGLLHYGWVRIETTLEQAIIKDYAYNTTSNQMILAGQMSLNISNAQMSNIIVSFISNNVVIDFSNVLNPNGLVSITNTLGNIVYNEAIDSNYTEINLANFASGMYIIKLETTYGIITKKIFK